MLFSAGFGAGLVFWGVAEPMSHFFSAPFAGVEGQTEEVARIAMGYSFFHWGVSQWSVFAIVGLVIGFLQFRKQKNGLVSTALEPVTGDKPIVKNTIDSLAVIATVMGIATSIGLGVLQMNGGLNAVFGTGNSISIQIVIILIIFVAYMLSSSTGLNKGIRYLSNLNLGLALVLLLFVFITSPTIFILETFTLAIGDYLQTLFNTACVCSRIKVVHGFVTGQSFIGHGLLPGHHMLVHLLRVFLGDERSVNTSWG